MKYVTFNKIKTGLPGYYTQWYVAWRKSTLFRNKQTLVGNKFVSNFRCSYISILHLGVKNKGGDCIYITCFSSRIIIKTIKRCLYPTILWGFLHTTLCIADKFCLSWFPLIMTATICWENLYGIVYEKDKYYQN